jgi:peptide/nickel transport system permease protein
MMCLMAVFAPFISPYNPNQLNLRTKFAPPSISHLCGTDNYGRDVLSRIIWGSRISLGVGITSVALGMLLGVPLGLVAGYLGGRVESALVMISDVMLSFPLLLLSMAMVAALGFSTKNVVLAIGILLAPSYIRLVRSSVLTVKHKEYVQAAKAIGDSSLRVMANHILPNILAPIIVISTLNVAWAILVEGALSFLGIGVQPPTATWGTIVADGRGFLRNAPWISTFGGLAIAIASFGLNLFGDGLRDGLDPMTRNDL